MMRPTERRARSAQLGQRSNDRRGFQIGPRIRVGGTLGKVGQNVKIAVGKAASNPILDSALALIPGVGPGISAAVNAAGHVLDTSGGGIHTAGDVGHMALDAGKAYVGGRVANSVRDGIGSIAKNGLGGMLSSAKKIITGGGSDGQGNFGMAGDLAGKLVGGGGDRGGLVDKLLLGAGVATSAADRMRTQGMQDKAAKYATDSYDTRAPLRTQGQSMALDQSTQDLGNLFSDSGNVYDNQKRGVAIGPKVPVRQLSY